MLLNEKRDKRKVNRSWIIISNNWEITVKKKYALNQQSHNY